MFKAIVPDPADEGVILVRGVPFGGPKDKDVHGQYFTQNTNFLSHILPLPPLFHFHGAKSGSLADQIGETIGRDQRDDGIWYRAKLFIKSNVDAVRQKAIQLWEAAKAGRLFASSGAVEATIKVADSGEITQWLVGELSLIDTRNNRENPASFHATVIPIKADLDDVETGELTVDNLNISTRRDNDDRLSIEDFVNNFINGLKQFYPNEKDIKTMFRQILGTNIPSTRSITMADETNAELLAQMQTQMAQMQVQMNELTEQNATLQNNIQLRDTTINELQTVLSTKSAEVAMGSHIGLVDNWIKEGKLTPAERESVLEVLSFAYQADTTTKGDIGFVNSIKSWIDAKPVNNMIGTPAAVYSNAGTLNGGAATQGPGGGIDQTNVERLKRYAEITG